MEILAGSLTIVTALARACAIILSGSAPPLNHLFVELEAAGRGIGSRFWVQCPVWPKKSVG
jgi:hypothetical protein